MINKKAIKRFLERPLDRYDWLKKHTLKDVLPELAALRPMPDFGTIKPWLHQFACFLLMVELKRFMLNIDMGGGKTLLILMLLLYRKQRGEKFKAVVFVPYITSVETWIEQVAEHAPSLRIVPLLGTGAENLEALKQDGDLFVVCYQSAVAMVTETVFDKRKGKNKWQLTARQVREYFEGFDTIILDEIHRCFPEGTRIKTPQGQSNIERLRPGDLVDTGFGYCPIKRVLTHSTDSLVRIILDDGKIITCTPEHLFLTDAGWVCAAELEGKNVFTERALLQSPYGVPSLWDTIFCGNSSIKDKEVLQQILCENTLQPCSIARGGGKDFSNTQSTGQWLRQEPWWKRKIYPSTSSNVESPGEGLGTRITNFIGASATGLSHLLQSGCGQQKIENSHRMRRQWPQGHDQEAERLKEKYKTGRVRVVNVSVLEQNNNTVVYNLEIEKHPYYFANGVLVHNCGSPSSLTYRMCRAISRECEYGFGLTGTPFGRDPAMLWPQFYLIDFGATLGPTMEFFMAVFYSQGNNYWGGMEFTFKKKLMPDLRRMIKNCSIRYSIDELHDMPEKVYVPKHMNAAPDAEAYCKAMLKQINEAVISKEKGSYKIVENSYLKLRQLSSGFMTFTGDDSTKIKVAFPDNPKLEALIDLIESMPSDSKIVIFHSFVYTNELISKRLKQLKIGHARIWGGQRDPIGQLRKFKSDANCIALVINDQSGSSSLNLQIANYVAFFEQPNSPINRQQAERRVWRPGQSKRVFIYDFFVRQTKDYALWQSNKAGEDLLQSIIGGHTKL